MKSPIRVAVTGAAGNIGYALLWRIASGDCFGADQPVILQLLEVTPALGRLDGTVMELIDSAFPLVHGVVATDDAEVAFHDAAAIFLVGSRPRSKDMDRADLVQANGPIFVGQGQAIAKVSRKDVKVITVGNPCNTNCMIAQANAKGLSPRQFTAMTRLDQNRAVGQLAIKLNTVAAAVQDVFIWGNHSNTMYPDVRLGSVNGEKLSEKVDETWLNSEFEKIVGGRGKAIIEARGASSAASAANAAVDHMRDWWQGSHGRIVSMALPSEGWYGVPEGLVFSFPCRTANGQIEVITDLPLTDHVKAMIKRNVDDLEVERVAVANLLG